MALLGATKGMTPADIACCLRDAGRSFSQPTISRWLAAERVPERLASGLIHIAFGIDPLLWSSQVPLADYTAAITTWRGRRAA